MHSPEIWTNAAREHLFERLVKLFGPAKEWQTSASPGRGLDNAFDEFCEAFARATGAGSGKAVKHQISFALQRNGHWKKGHVQNVVLNKAAALRVGFIDSKHLPTLSANGNNTILHGTREQTI